MSVVIYEPKLHKISLWCPSMCPKISWYGSLQDCLITRANMLLFLWFTVFGSTMCHCHRCVFVEHCSRLCLLVARHRMVLWHDTTLISDLVCCCIHFCVFCFIFFVWETSGFAVCCAFLFWCASLIAVSVLSGTLDLRLNVARCRSISLHFVAFLPEINGCASCGRKWLVHPKVYARGEQTFLPVAAWNVRKSVTGHILPTNYIY